MNVSNILNVLALFWTHHHHLLGVICSLAALNFLCHFLGNLHPIVRQIFCSKQPHDAAGLQVDDISYNESKLYIYGL